MKSEEKNREKEREKCDYLFKAVPTYAGLWSDLRGWVHQMWFSV